MKQPSLPLFNNETLKKSQTKEPVEKEIIKEKSNIFSPKIKEISEIAKWNIIKTLDFDNNSDDVKEFLKNLDNKNNCKLSFTLFWENFDIEIVNWWIDRIEVSWLSFKYSYKDRKFIVVAKQKWFIRKNAYEYKRDFLKWVWDSKRKYRSELNKPKPHPYFDEFLWK